MTKKIDFDFEKGNVLTAYELNVIVDAINNMQTEITPGDNISVNDSSISAIGYHYDASHDSMSEGYSTAFGYPLNSATGIRSHAEGVLTNANAACSHAEGGVTTANGNGSHAEGIGSVANNTASHAEGFSVAVEEYAHSEGYGTDDVISIRLLTSEEKSQHDLTQRYIGTFENIEDYIDVIIEYPFLLYNNDKTAATKTDNRDKITIDGSVYVVFDTPTPEFIDTLISIGDSIHCIYNPTVALGFASHAEGKKTRAEQDYSHAEGYESVAAGFASHAEGIGTVTYGSASHAEGGYPGYKLFPFLNATWEDGSTILTLNADNLIKDSLTLVNVYLDSVLLEYNGEYRTVVGFDGSVRSFDGITVEQIEINEPFSTTPDDYVSVNAVVNISKGTSAHSEGIISMAAGDYSHTESNSLATGESAHAEGGSSAIGDDSHAETMGITIGEYSHAETMGITIGEYSHAESTMGGLDTTDIELTCLATWEDDSDRISVISPTQDGGSASIDCCLVVLWISDGSKHKRICRHYDMVDGVMTLTVDETFGSSPSEPVYLSVFTAGAGGDYSHAEGIGTITTNTSEHAEGKFNRSNAGTIHSIGIGDTLTYGVNAVEVMDDGSAYLIGVGGYDGTNPNDASTLQQVIENGGGGGGISVEGSTGSIIYHDGTDWTALNVGSEGKALTVNNSNVPVWDYKVGTGTTNGNPDVLKIQRISQSDYNTLVSNNNTVSTTLYIISDLT